MLERIGRCFSTLAFMFVLGCTLGIPCSVASGSDPDARWVPTGNLNLPRSGHTATLLPNGKVLVAGGGRVDGSLFDIAELYDPATGTWSVTGRLNYARSGHSATLLPNGKVLVAGGFNWDPLWTHGATTELYDPATGIWTLTGSMIENRGGHTATLLRTGKVLHAFGLDDSGRGASAPELYDPVTGTWIPAGPAEGPIWSVTTLLANGKVLATGGSSDGDGIVGSSFVALYDPEAGTWTAGPSLPAFRQSHTATLLPSGKVLVAGGYLNSSTSTSSFDNSVTSTVSSILYDAATNAWSEGSSLATARASHTATLLPDGSVLVVGGYGADGSASIQSAELYDVARARWNPAGSMVSVRGWHTATLLQDGRVLIVGAGGASEIYNTNFTAAFTGSWYDPAQSGQGFMLEILPGTPMQLLASWFTFAPQGGQSWILGLGPINGSRAELQAFQPAGAGARFPPNFDAAFVRNEAWGTLAFTFSDCNHGHVDWVSTAPGYGSGGMDLTRLTLPAGLTCSP